MKSMVLSALVGATLGLGLLSSGTLIAPKGTPDTVASNYYLHKRTRNFYQKRPQRVRYKSFPSTYRRIWRG